jgi:hypothetical protein
MVAHTLSSRLPNLFHFSIDFHSRLHIIMISNTFIFSFCLGLVPDITIAFQPPENPTGLAGFKTPLVWKTPLATATTTKDFKNIITTEIMEQVSKAATAENMARDGTIRKRWGIGIDNAASRYEDEYWYNPKIHKFGNVGFLGAIHAALAPIATKVIDVISYDGQNIRSVVSKV